MPSSDRHPTGRRSWRLGELLPLLALLGAGCSPAARGTEAAGLFGPREQKPSPAVTPEQGRRLWTTLCRSCHGDDGGAQTALARELPVPPSDLSRCNFKYRSTPSGSLPRDEDLLRTIHVGIPGSAMPAFAPLLPRAALLGLVREVRARCDRFGNEAPEPPLPPPGWSRFTTSSAERGRAVYRRERCASCHGEHGRGDGPAARALRDLQGRPIQPRDHTRGVFRSGLRRLDLYRSFSTGLDGTPMPALPEGVSTADRWDLTNHLVSLSHDRCRLRRAVELAPSWYEPIHTWGLPWR